MMSPPSQSDHESPREVFRAVRAVRVTVARSVDELAMDVLESIPVWKMGIEDTQEFKWRCKYERKDAS